MDLVDYINAFMQSQGLRTRRQGEWLHIEGYPEVLSAVIAREQFNEPWYSIQADFLITLEDGRSIGGCGGTVVEVGSND